MNVAIAYDRVNKWGGAERVLLVLHEMFPEALLYTSVYNPETAPWARVFPKIIPSFLQKIPFASGSHELLAPLMPIAFESFSFDEYDLVISVTSEAAKGIITKPPTKHVCYCLTPTRYLWSGYDEYFKGLPFKGITYPIIKYLREWDRIASQRPDVIAGISSAVRDRIKKYYNREAEVIYPPVELKTQNSKVKTTIQKSKFYLIVSRLVPYKRVDLAIEVFSRLKLPLVIVGTGSEEKYLRSIAGKNIKFIGQVSEKELYGYYANSRALIIPQEEDFGLVSLEAQAFGKPVIAFKKGGSLDTVVDGKTGIFFPEQTVESLTNTIQKFDNGFYKGVSPEDCRKNAKRFSKERFKKEFLKICMS